MSKLPFTLESIRKRKEEKHLIPVTEEMLLVTNDVLPSHPEALPTIEKIYNALTLKGETVGLLMPKKYGLTVAEDESIREQSLERDKLFLELRELFEEVSQAEKCSFEEAKNMVFNVWGHQDVKSIHQNTGRIVKLTQKINATDTRKAEVTVFMQTRSSVNDWHEFDTLALNIVLFDAIYEYIDNERNCWKNSQVLGELMEEEKTNESLPSDSEKASSTPALAGTKST